MAIKNKKWWRYGLGLLALIIYIFIAARPIPKETILKPNWITSLESNYPIGIGDYSATETEEFLPFRLGEHYGYFSNNGKFIINQVKKQYLSMSENYWAEYESLPSSIQVMNPVNENILTIENPRGYPLFLDNRVFLVGNEQNSLTVINPDGEETWNHFFPAPITCIDASGGYVLAGTLDGTLILLNSSGKPAFTPFEPGGSRLSVIMGCAISRNASQLAVISGIDEQRFLLLERAGDTYRVIHHEFLLNGFRRPVNISFVDDDSKIAFECEKGLGIYDISARTTAFLPLDGEIVSIDNSGLAGFLFVVSSQGPDEMRLIAIRYPGVIILDAPFKSKVAFFSRRDKQLFLGGSLNMVSFELEKK